MTTPDEMLTNTREIQTQYAQGNLSPSEFRELVADLQIGQHLEEEAEAYQKT